MAEVSGLNFDNIAAATSTLNTELPRLRNLRGVQDNQRILDSLTNIRIVITNLRNDVRDDITNLRNEVRDIKVRQTRAENTLRRTQNWQKVDGNPAASLLPLLDPTTGAPIPDQPVTIAQTNRLSQAEANRILQTL